MVTVIQAIYYVIGRGCVAIVNNPDFNYGDVISISNANNEVVKETIVCGIETLGYSKKKSKQLGLLLRGLSAKDVQDNIVTMGMLIRKVI